MVGLFLLDREAFEPTLSKSDVTTSDGARQLTLMRCGPARIRA